MKKIEIVVRKDNSVYGEYDYIDILQLKLDIIEGRIIEPLYFRNEHGGVSEMSRINEFGQCSHYHDFANVDILLSEVVLAQMSKRIKSQNESDKN